MWSQDIFRFEDDQELMDFWKTFPAKDKQECVRLFAELLISYVNGDKNLGEGDDK